MLKLDKPTRTLICFFFFLQLHPNPIEIHWLSMRSAVLAAPTKTLKVHNTTWNASEIFADDVILMDTWELGVMCFSCAVAKRLPAHYSHPVSTCLLLLSNPNLGPLSVIYMRRGTQLTLMLTTLMHWRPLIGIHGLTKDKKVLVHIC